MSCRGGLCGRQSCQPCGPFAPFTAQLPVAGLNDRPYRQGRAQLSNDERTAILARDAGDGVTFLDVAIAQRGDTTQPFGTPDPIPNVNTTVDEVGASMTADGMTLYLESNQSDGYRMYVTSRSSPGGLFPPPTRLELTIGPTSSDGGQYVMPGGALYFQAYTSLTSDLFRGTPVGTAGLEAAPLGGVNTSSNDAYPVVSPDELTIYFSSTRTDGGARGGEDIWVATRTSTDGAFAAPRNVTELNTAADERPSWISGDGCRLYFDRGGSAGGPSTGIYVATRTR